jgi:uncharacterized membrane protein YphA (DoxX/SURF4 family)
LQLGTIAASTKEISMTVTLDSPRSRSRKLTIAAWILQGLLVLAFTAAAGAKFAGVPMMVEVFRQIGLGQWFRYVTATVEILGVIALLTPGFAGAGALWLGITMAFAILTHLLILQSSPAGAIVLCVLSLTLVWLRRSQFAALRARFA